MRLIWIDAYFMTTIVISVCTGITGLQRVFSASWLLALTVLTASALIRGTAVTKLIRLALYPQIPAIVLVASAPFAPHWRIEGWTDGILALWETPFEPLLELLPRFHVGHVSGLFLEDCALPIALPILVGVVGWGVRGIRSVRSVEI